jgi:hypothetical protein
LNAVDTFSLAAAIEMFALPTDLAKREKWKRQYQEKWDEYLGLVEAIPAPGPLESKIPVELNTVPFYGDIAWAWCTMQAQLWERRQSERRNKATTAAAQLEEMKNSPWSNTRYLNNALFQRGFVEALQTRAAILHGSRDNPQNRRTRFEAGAFTRGTWEFHTLAETVQGGQPLVKIFNVVVEHREPSLNQKKRRAVAQAIKALGREQLADIGQKVRESRIIEHVRDRTGLSVSDRYVRKIWKI